MTYYIWDEAKAALNLAKHGVSFEAAAEALRDPMALSVPDPHPDGNRWRSIGQPQPGLPTLLFVVHTEAIQLSDGMVARIISARAATRHERRFYEEG